MIVGIDPGLSGCVVQLSRDGDYVSHFFFRTVKIGKSSRIDLLNMNADFLMLRDTERCFIEKVGAMPGQGVSSMFNFGFTCGCIEMAAVGRGMPLTHVSPSSWKSKLGFSGQDKDAPRAKLSMRFPNVPDLQKKGKGQALADAICIAYAGMGWQL